MKLLVTILLVGAVVLPLATRAQHADVADARLSADSSEAPSVGATDTLVAPDPLPADSLAADLLAAPDTLAADSLATHALLDSVTQSPPDNQALINSAGAVSPDEWFVVTARVDTSDAEVRAIMKTWRSYMIARYEGLDGAWLWSVEERLRWDAFNLFAPYVFNAPNFFGSRRATVLSAERSGDLYCVRTMFDERSYDGTTSRIDPWAIVRVYFEKKNEQWWIRNALGVLTQDWMVSRVRFITFVYPKSHDFDLPRAMHAAAFCDSVIEEFPFLSAPPFHVYITDDPEHVDRLLGLDYLAVGSNKSIAMPGRGVVVTSRGTEWNPREMLQMLMGRGLAPHPIVRDGFTGWVGGWSGASYRENMRRVSRYLAENDSLEFDDLLSSPLLAISNPDLKYAPGAVLCDIAWAKNGNAGILELFNSGPSSEGIYRSLQKIFGIDRERFQFMWSARVRELR